MKICENRDLEIPKRIFQVITPLCIIDRFFIIKKVIFQQENLIQIQIGIQL